MIDMIDFDIDGSVRVIIAGGARAYQFHDGALTGSVDLMPIMDDQLRAGLTGNNSDQLEKLRKIV
jgi:hypothetical protein